MTSNKILFGFEVPSGDPVYIRRHHTVITGMTNLTGKTTALEGLAVRAAEIDPNFHALAFMTKRGERGFETTGETIPLYYRERADWRYVESLLSATMSEKMKFERAWIIRACKGTQNLNEVRENIVEILADKKHRLRDFDRNIYTTLVAYFDIVIPVLDKLEFVDVLRLDAGISVMDVRGIYTKPEVQSIIIRSAMETILEDFNDTTPMLPEAWKFLPQGRNTPVKAYFEQFIREGATNNNYLWIDAQDLGGVDKEPLRNVSTWIMGKMLQFDEVQRLLKQMLGADVSAHDVQTLPLGQFYIVQDDDVRRAYALPAYINEEIGRAVAMGERSAEDVKEMLANRYAKIRSSREFVEPKPPPFGSKQNPTPWTIEDSQKFLKLVERVENIEKEIETLW